MKQLMCIALIGLLLTSGCKKDKPVSAGNTLPFENDNIKLERVTASVPSTIRDIFFFNASTGIVVSYDGKIYKTTDVGVSWNVKYTNPTTNQPLYQIFFEDSNIGYAVGGSTSCDVTGCVPPGGLILKTTDGGDTWTNVLQEPSVEFISISANNLGELFAISNVNLSEGRIYKGTETGTNWTMIDSVPYMLHKISFNDGFGFCTGSNGRITRSTDNGATWALSTTLSANYITDIKFINGTGYCISGNQNVYKTTDNGNNWIEKLSNHYGVFVLNPSTTDICVGFGAGSYSGGDLGIWNGKIIQTTNGGNDWVETQLDDIFHIRYASFYSATEGYAVTGTALIKVTVK